MVSTGFPTISLNFCLSIGSDNIDVLIFAISMALQLLRQLNGSLAEGAIFSSINHKLHCFLSVILAELGVAADL
ncbi:hypothetical protein IUJ34_27160 (plasmid) [Klebsiella pneumoniae subsp. pneumoniae]|uniref:Uncharacterized protein n=1 Tax=Klebsiella pneumoniae subsp. pneumoniae TaxID=72407 RepID=A0A7S9E1S9_KLEPN|nr:hypothetical protein IUJ34_27160 [Klebsiella pneumoniae subsp. pneumoniae]